MDGINAVKVNQGAGGQRERGDDEIFIERRPTEPGKRDGMLRGFKAGMLLRGLAAAELAADAGRIAMDRRTRG